MAHLEVIPHEGRALIGIAREDITPPVGIYGRMWGASSHDRSEGAHKSLFVTALSIQQSAKDQPALLIAIDAASLGDLDGREAHWLRERICKELGLLDSHLMLACSHTHASPWSARSRAHMPGGDLVEQYLHDVSDAMCKAGSEAIANTSESIITFADGKCSLASNRDLLDPHDPTRYLTGFNPDTPADETVLVGRITRVKDSLVVGTIVNYACHPTSLGWDNKLASPDYVGAMREIVEAQFKGAPCLFLQGASGDLAPAYQYVADTAVADQHGAQLGYAALGVLASMNPAGEKFEFKKAVESGAPLGYWEPTPYEVPTQVRISANQFGLPTKPWPTVEELDQQWAQTEDSFAKERIFRKKSIAKLMSGSSGIELTIYGWRIGNILLVGAQCEVYSIWQRELRKAFPEYAVVAITCVDYEAIGYVVPDQLQDLNLYTAWQLPFGKGVMQALLAGSKEQMKKSLS